MAKKIPSVTGYVEWNTMGHADVPLQQQSEFGEYREFMAAYCEARLWWLSEAWKPDASPARKFWFQNRYAASICYAIGEAWHRGYWLTRQELRANCATVPDSQFQRLIRQAQEAGYISLDPMEGDDARQKLVRPSRTFIVFFEGFTYQYYKVICDNSHKHNQFTQGLRERIDQIESQDDFRKNRLGWSVHDEYPEMTMKPVEGLAGK